jgi:hypothetical protein
MQWAALLALSLFLAVLFGFAHLPAGVLLGSMAAAILIAANGGTVRVPDLPFVAAQSAIGCLIARTMRPPIFYEMAHDWPLFVFGVVSVVAASSLLGWLLTRWRVLPGSSAIWGSSPGAANAMVLLAEAFGADVRLVAFMLYLRVICVAVVAAMVSRLWSAGSNPSLPYPAGFETVSWLPFIETLALMGIGICAMRTRIPAGPLLVPLVAGTVLQDAGLMTIALPKWLLMVSYAFIGWGIGLRFTRAILIDAMRALPSIAASIFTLIAICGGVAAILVVVCRVDPLTAYLATSPGGADSIAIIASSSKVDLPFVMAMQSARFIVVLVTGPSIARFIAGRSARYNA